MNEKFYLGVVFRNGVLRGFTLDNHFSIVWYFISENIDIDMPLVQFPIQEGGVIIHLTNLYKKEGCPNYNLEVIIKEIPISVYPAFDERED